MFIDKVSINVISGKGGDGAVSFHREKYVPNGGPDGGDGGKGGDIVLLSDPALNNLGEFRFRKKFKAGDGENGGPNNCSGKDAADLIIKVPIGTVVFNEQTGRLLFDFTEDGQTFIAAPGGRGGSGNQHFASSTRQAPKFAKPGDESQDLQIVLELKTIADIGLIGFPNVGKSTMLSVITNAKPKIANYHFTTLSPNLGIVKYKNAPEFVVADIPGLIEGASQGLGLGYEFLRHVERTRMLIHILDASGSEGRDPREDFDKINDELSEYSSALAERPQAVVLNKIDLISDPSETEELKVWFEQKGYSVFCVSAAANKGLSELLDYIIEFLPTVEYTPMFITDEEIQMYAPARSDEYTIEIADGVYYLSGTLPERLLKTVNLDDYESSQYFQRVLKNKGVFRALENKGITDGDTLDICGYQFDYYK